VNHRFDFDALAEDMAQAAGHSGTARGNLSGSLLAVLVDDPGV
jgi:hypothetical protein